MNSTTDLLFSLHARYPGLMAAAIALFKGTAILCLAWGLSRWLRHRSAVSRAWVWRSGFVALLLLAAWPYRPLLLNALTLEVQVPTEAVVVSYSSLRQQPVNEPAEIAGKTTEPLIIARDASLAGATMRAVRKVDPWIESVWWMVFAALLGFKVVLARLGLWRLWNASRRAAEEVQEACAEVAKESRMSTTPDVRIAGQVGSPLLTSGRQPVIWLPKESADWSAAKLKAVLHHEIAHLARADGRWQWLATAAACFWWWNPAVWFALSRLKAETEQAADEVVVSRKVSASEYAQALIEIASAWLPRAEPALGVPMLGMSEIESRVRELLRDHPWRGKLGAMAGSGIAMLAVLMSGIVLVSCKQQAPRYISLAKLVAGGRMVAAGGGTGVGVQYQDYLQDFYGTIIETIESSEMRRRALDRVRALHPDKKESSVEIKVTQNNGSAIFNVVAIGQEPNYTRIFLDALLDEFVSFRNQIRETQRNKALTSLAEDVVRREKALEEKSAKLAEFEKKNNVVILQTTSNAVAQQYRRLVEEREEGMVRITDLNLAAQDIPTALHEIERGLRGADTSRADGGRAGLTLTETDYLQNKLALIKLKAEKERLSKLAGADDPKLIEVTGEIAKLESLIQFEEKEVAEGFKRSASNLQMRVKSLDAQIEDSKKQASDAGAKLATYEMLKRDQSEVKKAYDEILELVRRFTVSEDMTSDHVTIMERASGALKEEPKGWFGKSSAKAVTSK